MQGDLGDSGCMAADAESLTPTFLVSIVDRYLRSALRKGFLGRHYVVEGNLRFKVGLLSFIDGGIIGHLLRGEPNILRVVATGDLDGPGTIPVETISDAFVESLRVQSSEAIDPLKYGGHFFSALYIVPQVGGLCPRCARGKLTPAHSNSLQPR